MKNKPVVIYDLDGCVSNDLWRRYMLPDYETYHFFCHSDLPANREIWPKNYDNFTPIIITSRPEWFRIHTEKWLKENEFFYVQLYMRPNGDLRTSPELKSAIIKQVNIDYSNPEILVAYDDRDDILDAYKLLNINTKKVDIK